MIISLVILVALTRAQLPVEVWQGLPTWWFQTSLVHIAKRHRSLTFEYKLVHQAGTSGTSCGACAFHPLPILARIHLRPDCA